MKMTLVRTDCSDSCTIGRLEFTDASGNDAELMTLELPWRDNKRGCSCIPKGTYTCKKVQSRKFGETFEITGVEGRDSILFHKGNFPSSTRGCILLGLGTASCNGGYMITDSARAMEKFLAAVGNAQQFTLEII